MTTNNPQAQEAKEQETPDKWIGDILEARLDEATGEVFLNVRLTQGYYIEHLVKAPKNIVLGRIYLTKE
jgi:hypothetical protein